MCSGKAFSSNLVIVVSNCGVRKRWYLAVSLHLWGLGPFQVPPSMGMSLGTFSVSSLCHFWGDFYADDEGPTIPKLQRKSPSALPPLTKWFLFTCNFSYRGKRAVREKRKGHSKFSQNDLASMEYCKRFSINLFFFFSFSFCLVYFNPSQKELQPCLTWLQ